jgi:hypothetical protein
MSDIERPQFQHDCDSCYFLGRRGEFDLYCCSQSELGPSLIARYGNNGPEYSSMSRNLLKRFHTVSEPSSELLALKEALRRFERNERY